MTEQRIAERAVFSIGEDRYTWEDVVLAGLLWGEWIDLERELREGIACVRHAEQTGQAGDDAELQEAASEFRLQRDLISAEETEDWLARRGLSVEEWLDHLHRRWLRENWASRLDDLRRKHPVADAEVEAAILGEGFATGLLDRLAARLAGRAALCAEEGAGLPQGAAAAADPPVPRAPGLAATAPAERAAKMLRVSHLEASFQEARKRPPEERSLEDCVRANHTAWLQVEFDWLAFAEEPAAREAALCLRVDGQPLEEVARQSGSEVRRTRAHLETLEPALAELLLCAAPGQVVGPVAREDGQILAVARAKQPPSLADADIRRRAHGRLVDRAIAAAVNRQVRWAWPGIA